MTNRGQLLSDVLAGHEVEGVSETAVRHLCVDLAGLTPPRYVRAQPRSSGEYCVALVGPPIAAFQRDELAL